MRAWKNWLVVIIFASAMAWVEAAVVVYLRTLIDRLEPYQTNPLPHSIGLGQTELVREVATLVMLGTVGWLAGKTPRSRLGYALVAFGVWDILYYAWLKLICDWPSSLLGWDILFLVPLPWWGPVLAPVLIAGLMIAGGTLVSVWGEAGPRIWPSRLAWLLNLGGVGLALYVFMADALRALGVGSPAALRSALPQAFNRPLFAVALVLLAAPIVDVGKQIAEGAPRGAGHIARQMEMK